MIKGYYFITDSSLSKNGNVDDVKKAIKAGVTVVQYRNKDASSEEMRQEAFKLKDICKDKALFLINDNVDVARSINADGVHLGQDDMPYEEARKVLGDKKIIGVTVHNVQEALSYEKKGADYLGVSPIFSTTTKLDAGKPGGIDLIRDIRKISSLPIVAIGGIDLSNAREVIEAGADMICAIRAVVTKSNVAEEIRRFQDLFKESLT